MEDFQEYRIFNILVFCNKCEKDGLGPSLLLYLENPALDVGFQNAYSYGGNKKTPSDIIKDAVWQLHFNIRRRTFR